MMETREYAVPGGSIVYQVQIRNGRKEAVITGASGLFGSLSIPEELDGCPVTEIGRKAFLSHKRLRRVVLPKSLVRLEDWAFAYCDGLEQVQLPRKQIFLGRAVFLECPALERLEIGDGSGACDWDETGACGGNEASVCSRDGAGAYSRDGQTSASKVDLSELVAAAVTFFQAYYLVDPPAVGSAEWLAKWDNRMQSYLDADDQEGFARQVLCGEEDYGSTDLGAFVNGRRKDKARLAYLRLLNPTGLSGEASGKLSSYLCGHTKGCTSEEAWEVLLEGHGDDRRYFELFVRLGCLTEENFDAVLEDIGQDCPEMKAYFLRIKQEQMGQCDFFADLSLD